MLRLYKELGYGTTTWSPLYGGFLAGKYNNGEIPKGSRADLENFEWMKERAKDQVKIEASRKLAALADDLGITEAQLSLAWILKNPHVSTVITGASKVSQVHENMKAIDAKEKLTDEVMEKIEDIFKDIED